MHHIIFPAVVGQGSPAADELDTGNASNAFDADYLYQTDLAGGPDVRAATRIDIKTVDLDESNALGVIGKLRRYDSSTSQGFRNVVMTGLFWNTTSHASISAAAA